MFSPTPGIVLLPTAYFPSAAYFMEILRSQSVWIEQMETYPKQTYRNRCEIMTSAGKMKLIVPVTKPGGNHTITRDAELSYRQPWQQHHWKSIRTAYRSSPYFNYYADVFKPIFEEKEKTLIDLNYKILILLNKLIGLKAEIAMTVEYLKQPEGIRDLRFEFTPKKNMTPGTFPEYPQVFSHLHGFQRNLSVLDLIFNLGPETLNYLKTVNQQPA